MPEHAEPQPPDLSPPKLAPPDRAAQALAVVLLLAMFIFSSLGERDDKAWKMWTDPVKEWWSANLGG